MVRLGQVWSWAERRASRRASEKPPNKVIASSSIRPPHPSLGTSKYDVFKVRVRSTQKTDMSKIISWLETVTKRDRVHKIWGLCGLHKWMVPLLPFTSLWVMIGNKNMVVRVRALCARIHLRPNYFVCVWYAIQIQHGSERGRGRKDGRAECSYRSPISRPIHHNQNVDSSNCELRSSSLPSSELCTL